jgi:FkbM family methyltransferase
MPSLDQRAIAERCRLRAEGWDEEQRYAYPLTAESLVWDVGAWNGDFSRRIVNDYRCSVELFEILPRQQDALRYWFRHDKYVHVHNFGLGAADEVLLIRDDSECTSMLVTGEVEVHVRRMAKHLPVYIHVDLVKLNIEGSEYDLLEDLCDTGGIHKIENLQVQFHDYVQLNGVYIEVPNAAERYAYIAARLRETHEMQWQQPWVWESWRKR